MTKLTYTKIVKKKTECEVPDYYGYDDTRLGKVVDFLLKDYEIRGRSVRDQMYDQEDGDQVEECIRKLERAYAQAREIAEILGVKT